MKSAREVALGGKARFTTDVGQRNFGIEHALASLATQDFADFEIVLVDNGSRDSTACIVADWTSREPRIRAVRTERPGLARSLNHAAALARALPTITGSFRDSLRSMRLLTGCLPGGRYYRRKSAHIVR
jgi:hypothetical protein